MYIITFSYCIVFNSMPNDQGFEQLSGKKPYENIVWFGNIIESGKKSGNQLFSPSYNVLKSPISYKLLK